MIVRTYVTATSNFFWEDGVDILFPILPMNTSNKPWRLYIQNKHKKTLKGGGQKADWLGTSGPEE